MRYLICGLLTLLASFNAAASAKDSLYYYSLPDSVKAVSFIATVTISPLNTRKEVWAGIKTSTVSLVMEAEKKEREVKFSFPGSATILATGMDVEKDEDELEWEYDWKENVDYKLLIASAADSAGNFTIYSGYIWLPEAGKWKLIGSCRVNGEHATLKAPASFYSTGRKNILPRFTGVWVQRPSGSWKSMDGSEARPSITPMPAFDSVRQYQHDRDLIQKAIALGKTEVDRETGGVFYRILDPGNGKTISVTDTVTVKYQLNIFQTTEIIDQASEKPATFPLNRLIKAWQLAVPLVKTGGKLKIVIPSGLAYSIRTRAARIPPNSILEFRIEVLDTQPAK